MSTRIIEVVEYRDEWCNQFSQEKALIQSVLTNDNVVAIHHIGSTSVKGLCAKPIIDILIEVKSLEELDSDSHLIEAIGYLAKGEFGIAGRRYFQKGDVQRSHHVHAFLFDSMDAKRHLAFRDYLIAFPNIASEYASIKRDAATVCDNDIDVYCNYKDSFVKEHEAKAMHWKSV